MKSGSRNYSQNRARNYGQSIRTPDIVDIELKKSTQNYDNAFTVATEAAYLYRYHLGERPCSHLNWAATGGENFPEDDEFEAPVIIIQDEDIEGEEGEEILDETLEMLQETKDICPLCYGTGRIGSYRVANSFEIYLDTTYEKIVNKKSLDIEGGKPFFFLPVEKDASITFRVNLPAYFGEFSRLTTISKEARGHLELSRELVKIGPVGQPKEILSEVDLAALLQSNSRVDIEFSVLEPTHGFFMRFLNGRSTININFPHFSKEIEEGESDYISSITASAPSFEDISTKDVIKELKINRFWKVTSVENKTGQGQELGKDLGLRRVRNFERFALLP